MTISEFRIDDKILYNSPILAEIVVKNIGQVATKPEYPFKVGMRVGSIGKYYSSDYSEEILPGQSVTMAVYDADGALPIINNKGEYSTSAFIECSGTENDIRRNNNQISKTIEVDGIPDLVVTDIIVPNDIKDGQDVEFTAKIKNKGTGKIKSNIKVGFKIDDSDYVVWSDYNVGLYDGESIKLTSNVGIDGDKWKAVLGEHTVTAVVDYTNEIEELNEDNNEYFEDFTVKKKCDLKVESILIEPSNPIAGESVTLKARIKNIGEDKSPFNGNIKASFKINDEDLGISAEAYGISLGASEALLLSAKDIQWTPQSTGSYTITAEVDTENIIDEADESNNTLAKQVNVTSLKEVKASDDYDSDGLNNSKENSLGTDPNNHDTDGDLLSDFDEVNASNGFKTDPLNPDTDEDGIFDSVEIKLGKNPLVKDENSFVTINASNEDNSVTVETYGDNNLAVCTLDVNEINSHAFDSIEGIIRNPVEISAKGHGFNNALITFNYNELDMEGINEEDLTIYWVDYENSEIVPLEDYNVTIDTANKRITGKVNHFSTYVPGVKSLWKISFKKDIAFAIDESGSMSSSDGSETRKNFVEKFVTNIKRIDSNIAIIKFSSDAESMISSSNIEKDLKDALNKEFDGAGQGTDIGSGLKCAREELIKSNNRRFIVLVSDGENGYDTGSVTRYATQLAKENIRIISVGAGSDANYKFLSDLAYITGGKYFNLDTSLTGDSLESQIHHIYSEIVDYINLEKLPNIPTPEFDPKNKIPSKLLEKGYVKEGNINFGGDIDVYEFVPEKDMTCTIFSSGTTDVSIDAYDDFTHIASNDDDVLDINFHLELNLLKGKTYRFEVRHYDDEQGTGEYSICFVEATRTSLDEDQTYLRTLALETGADYKQDEGASTATVKLKGKTVVFDGTNSHMANGEIVVTIQSFVEKFGLQVNSTYSDEVELFGEEVDLIQIAKAGDYDESYNHYNVTRIQQVLKKLDCWVDEQGRRVFINEVHKESLKYELNDPPKYYGKITTSSVKMFQKKYMGELLPLGTVDQDTADEMNEYRKLMEIDKNNVKPGGVKVREYLEKLKGISTNNNYSIGFDGKNVTIFDISKKVKETLYIPEMEFTGKKCYAKVRYINYALEKNKEVGEFGSNYILLAKQNFLKLMGDPLWYNDSADTVFKRVKLTNSVDTIDAYWDSNFETAITNFLNALGATYKDAIKYVTDKGDKAVIISHWSSLELIKKSFYENPVPLAWMKRINNRPLKGTIDGNYEEITAKNKYKCQEAIDFYRKNFYIVERVRNWSGTDNALRKVWMMAAYGVSVEDKGGLIGGIDDGFYDYWKETLSGIFTGVFEAIKDPVGTLEGLMFLMKAMVPLY